MGEPECVFEVNNRFIGTYVVYIGMYEITSVKQLSLGTLVPNSRD